MASRATRSMAPVVNSPRGPGPPLSIHNPAAATKSTMAAVASRPSAISARSTRAERWARRTTFAQPTTTIAIATGLAIIHATSVSGNVDSAVGCIQYDVTDSVEAQLKAATPPGTSPWWAQGCPPVPGHPFPK
jgi:hypothetical protein